MRDNNPLNVILIDDMADIISQKIDKMIDGVYISKRDLNDRIYEYFQKYNETLKNALIFIDGTYENKEIGVSAIDVAERLYQKYPHLRDNIHILLGSDVNTQYQAMAGNGDFEAQVFLSRIRALPHTIYNDNNRNQTKLNVMLNTICSFAKKRNYKIEKRLPSGEVSPEILEIAKKNGSKS